MIRKFSLLLLFINILWQTHSINILSTRVRFKNVKCRNLNRNTAIIDHCYIRDCGNRACAVVMGHMFHMPITEARVHVKLLRKRQSDFMPFLIDNEIDWCKFVDKRDNELFAKMFALLEKVSNLNQKCPIKLNYIGMNATLPKNKSFVIPFRFPPGAYMINLDMSANKDMKANILAYLDIDV